MNDAKSVIKDDEEWLQSLLQEAEKQLSSDNSGQPKKMSVRITGMTAELSGMDEVRRHAFLNGNKEWHFFIEKPNIGWYCERCGESVQTGENETAIIHACRLD